MRQERYGKLAMFCGLAIVLLLCIASGQSQSQSQKAKGGDKEEQIEPQPLAPPPATAEERALRDRIGARYNVGGMGPTLDSEERRVGMPGPVTSIMPTPVPPLPFAESSLVILGRATRRQPYLSQDRRSIYTEVTVLVEEVFKTSSTLNTRKGDALILLEPGGSARLPNGRVITHVVRGTGAPLQGGGRYVLFLLSCAEDVPRFFIRTAWELRADRIIATQVHALSGRDELLGKSPESFLATVRASAR